MVSSIVSQKNLEFIIVRFLIIIKALGAGTEGSLFRRDHLLGLTRSISKGLVPFHGMLSE
jgi:hypothetical protein